VLRALLYGTRLSRPELVELASRTFVTIPGDLLDKALKRNGHWQISKEHPRLRLEELDEELLQGMLATVPRGYIGGKPGQVESLFKRQGRLWRGLEVPDSMLNERVLEDVKTRAWETVPDEAKKAGEWLRELSSAGDPRLERLYRSQEFVSDRQWQAVINPPRRQVHRVMQRLAGEGMLETRIWFREIGRPATAYFLPGKPPFLEERCGQCAFYVPAKRNCRLWWLVDKKRRFFDHGWREAGSLVTPFEIHKMKYAWRIGPHSSACTRFIDKKRDHLRKAVPPKCEICGEALRAVGRTVICQNCHTKYVKYTKWGEKEKEKVKVLTAYEHEFNRLYHEITGGDAAADYQEVRREIRSRLPEIMKGKVGEEDVDVLADELPEPEPGPPRVWPRFDRELQDKVNRLAQTTDVARRFSIAMARSAISATRRIGELAKLNPKEVAQAVTNQGRYLARIEAANPAHLLTYEALIMNQYWKCYRLALGKGRLWFGPRKRGRFVSELVGSSAGRARGYTAVDAAINYLHQRRLRQAERINAEIGFTGTCNGFLHKERYNSRGIGLLLDMIDPFKFADREELLVVTLNGGISWTDFRLERDRRGSTFYYPAQSAESILNQAGSDADEIEASFGGRETKLSEAYRQFATGMLSSLGTGKSDELEVFVFSDKISATS
jgi:hypothetical protein